MAQKRTVRAINLRKKQGFVTYSMDQEGEFSKVFVDISSVCLTGFGMISSHAEQLQISFSP